MTERVAIPSPAVLGSLLAVGFTFALWLALSIHGALPVWAQSAPVELRMRVEKVDKVESENIYVGDPFTITLSATYPPDHFVIFPQVPSEWGDFEVRNQTSVPTTANEDGTLTSSIQIEAVLFSTGDIPTPELSVAIRKPDGEVIYRPVKPIDVAIEKSLADDENELRDIKPQAELAVPPDPLSVVKDNPRLAMLTLAGGIGLAALVILLWRRRQFSAIPVLGTPAEIALRELDRIASLSIDSDSDFKERYILVSECLRTYLRDQFDIPALELTTRQILQPLEPPTASESVLRNLKLNGIMVISENWQMVGLRAKSGKLPRILEECDLVKFARFLPDQEDANQIIERSREFVGETGTVPDADKNPVAVGAESA